MSGLSRTPGKRVWVNSPPRVRIPPVPPIRKKDAPFGAFFISSLAQTMVFLGHLSLGLHRVVRVLFLEFPLTQAALWA